MSIVAMDIATARLLLIHTYKVVDEHVDWLNDKNLMKWSEQRYKDHSYTSQAQFLEDARFHGNPLVWDIRLAPTPAIGSLLGESRMTTSVSIGSLHAYCDERHRRVDLGIMLGPQYHGNGYAAEAWDSVCMYLATKHHMRKFEAALVDGNVPIMKMLMRLGWAPEARREHHFIIDGQPYGLVLFGKVYP